jgi:hypothetical protein
MTGRSFSFFGLLQITNAPGFFWGFVAFPQTIPSRVVKQNKKALLL